MSFGAMRKVTFDDFTIIDRSGVCSICGKKRKRRLKFSQTVNPFNTNLDGTVKTYDEVRDAVRTQHKASLPLPFVCAKCDTTGRMNGN